MTEQWRRIPGWGGWYEASDLGRIRSVDRVVIHSLHGPQNLRGKILKPFVKAKGYLYVTLYSSDRVHRDRSAHSLVLEAFVGACPEGMECCHGDGDPANNRLENLRWDTALNNAADMKRHGTHYNTAKKRCKRGHEFTTENTYTSRAGRACRQCRRDLWHERYKTRLREGSTK